MKVYKYLLHIKYTSNTCFYVVYIYFKLRTLSDESANTSLIAIT